MVSSFEKSPNNKDHLQKGGVITPEAKKFDLKNFTLLLGVNKEDIELSELAEKAMQEGFDEKNEIHITVVGFKNGGVISKLFKGLPPGEREVKISEIQNLIEGTDWSFSLSEDKFRISKEYKTPDPNNKGSELTEQRQSYIRMVKCDGIINFYEKLNAILGTNLEVPPAHMTLFTNGSDKEKAKIGIGINTEAELSQMNPERI